MEEPDTKAIAEIEERYNFKIEEMDFEDKVFFICEATNHLYEHQTLPASNESLRLSRLVEQKIMEKDEAIALIKALVNDL